MSGERRLNSDFMDVLRCLAEAGAEFVVVGAHALAVHGIPRATGDIDIFVRPSAGNAERVLAALRAFGAPVAEHGVTVEDLARAGAVYQIGLPPRRIDILTEISGVGFDEAWSSRMPVEIEGVVLGFLGLEALVRNKRAAGRAKDLADLEALGRRPS